MNPSQVKRLTQRNEDPENPKSESLSSQQKTANQKTAKCSGNYQDPYLNARTTWPFKGYGIWPLFWFYGPFLVYGLFFGIWPLFWYVAPFLVCGPFFSGFICSFSYSNSPEANTLAASEAAWRVLSTRPPWDTSVKRGLTHQRAPYDLEGLESSQSFL